MKVGFITLGCKVNIYESNALKNELTSRGFTVGEADSNSDVFIINTCSVTNTADAKSRKMIHKCIKMNPNALVCVMGCYSQTNEEASSIEGVDILIGNGNKKSVVDAIEEMLKNGYNLGGEQSGHIILLDYNPTGDGILTSLMLIMIMLKEKKKASEMKNIINIYPQVLVNAKVSSDKKMKYTEDKEINEAITKLEEEFKRKRKSTN